MSTLEIINHKVSTALPGVEFKVLDESDEHFGHAGFNPRGSHFRIQIVLWQKMSRLSLHRMLYQILATELANGDIHALAIEVKEN